MAMRSARRLASIAVVATLAVAGLSACRSEPSTVAYVGDTTITEARVTDVYNEVYDAVSATPPAKGTAVAMPITRTDVAQVLVSEAILPEVARQHNVSLPADLAVSEYANAKHVPADSEYARLFAQSVEYVNGLRQQVTSAPALTDEDLREVYDALLATGQLPAGTPFDQFKGSLPEENTQAVQTAIAARNEITEVAGKMNVTVNPRYQPMTIPVLFIQTQQGAISSLVNAPVGASGPNNSVPVTAAAH